MRKILLQISIFSSILILIFSLNRIFMHFTFIPDNLVQNKNEFFLMYILGAYHDIRFLSVAFLPLFLCGFLSLIFMKFNGGGGV